MQLVPFETHEDKEAAHAAEVVFLISWQALTLHDFAAVVSVDPRGISQMQPPSVPSTHPASEVYVEQAAKAMHEVPLVVHLFLAANPEHPVWVVIPPAEFVAVASVHSRYLQELEAKMQTPSVPPVSQAIWVV